MTTTTTLRQHWNNIAFYHVTRNIARAQDLSLWYNPTDQPSDRKYLGDNSAVLNSNTIDASKVTWEYDYFYGFCSPITLQQKNDRRGNSTTMSVHFASPNAAKINEYGDWVDDYVVILPTVGTLICGTPQTTDRGMTLSKWWVCPPAFYELWKLVMPTRTWPPNYDVTGDMNRLSIPVYQVMAAIVVFYKKTIPRHVLSLVPPGFVDALRIKYCV